MTQESAAGLVVEMADGGVLVARINRPQRLGAYTPALCNALLDVLRQYEHDDDLGCLLLTGTGRGFCTGGDLSPDAGFDLTGQVARARDLRDHAHALVRALHATDKPVVCAVNGIAVNGGLAFALACDLRVAARSARAGDTTARVGLLPDEGGAWLFPRAMGGPAAYRMVALAEVYAAERARELGLFDEVVDDEVLYEHTLDIARRLAAGPPLALRAVKSLLREAAGQSLEAAFTAAQHAVLWVGPSEDAQEGKRAFIDKRSPRFRGV